MGIQKMIQEHEELWSMLQVNTGLEPEFCKATVFEVVMRKQDANGDGGLSLEEFGALYDAVLSNPKGQLDFFHEVLFAAYDHDGCGKLDSKDLDDFLNLFYDKSSIFCRRQALARKGGF